MEDLRDLLADVEWIKLTAMSYMYRDNDELWGSVTDFWNKRAVHQGIDEFVS
jgi:hypothetical protein